MKLRAKTQKTKGQLAVTGRPFVDKYKESRFLRTCQA